MESEILPKIVVELRVCGGPDFDPDMIQQHCNLIPDRIKRIGEPVCNTLAKYKHNIWVLSTGYIRSISTAECIELLVSKYENMWEELLFLATFDVEVDVELSIGIYVYEGAPDICISPEIVRNLSKIGGGIDVDVIPLCTGS